jgi:hypothetical protein
MRQHLSVICAAVFAACAFGQADLMVETSASRLSTASSSFSDKSTYNSYSQAQSPLGLLDIQDNAVQLDLGYRFLGLSDVSAPDSASEKLWGYCVPSLTIAKPHSVVLNLNYRPDIVETRTAGVTLSMPLQRFGFSLAGQTSPAIFRIGIGGQGFYGQQKTSTNADIGRAAMGVDNLGLFIGSQIHKLLRLGFSGTTEGLYDSLKPAVSSPTGPADRFAFLRLPLLGFDADFGAEDFPVLSNFVLKYSPAHFIYVVKQPSDFSYGGNGYNSGNKNVIGSDSLAWQWKTMVELTASAVTYRPSFCLGYWHLNSGQFVPTDNNDVPFNHKDAVDGYDWQFSSFMFGIGGSCTISKYGDAWLEYGHSTLNFAPGVNIHPALATSADQSRGYNRFGVGLESNVGKLPKVQLPSWAEIFFRAGFLIMRENATLNAYHGDEFEYLYPVTPNSQKPRYQPWLIMAQDERITNMSFGLGAAFLERLLSLNFHLGIVGRQLEGGPDSRHDRGIELDCDLTYGLRSAK